MVCSGATWPLPPLAPTTGSTTIKPNVLKGEDGDVLQVWVFFFWSEKSIQQIKDNSVVSVVPWAPLGRSQQSKQDRVTTAPHQAAPEPLKLL